MQGFFHAVNEVNNRITNIGLIADGIDLINRADNNFANGNLKKIALSFVIGYIVGHGIAQSQASSSFLIRQLFSMPVPVIGFGCAALAGGTAAAIGFTLGCFGGIAHHIAANIQSTPGTTPLLRPK